MGEMTRRILLRLVAALILLPGCSGCSNGADAPDGDGTGSAERAGVIRVEAVNYPLRYLAERIGGEWVEVSFRAPFGSDPADWIPDPGDITAMQEADLVLLNGAGQARWMDRSSLAPSRLVDTSRSFRDRYLAVDRAVTHSHGPGGEHTHDAIASTTWLDPLLAIEQAATIRDAFRTARPAFRLDFDSRFAALASDLERLDRTLLEAFAGLAEGPLLASHPVYEYLARRYGLDLKSVHFEPDRPPDEREWQELRSILRSHPARWMLWEAAPVAATIDRLHSLGIGIIVFDPCAGAPSSGDFLSVQHDNAERVIAASRRADEGAVR